MIDFPTEPDDEESLVRLLLEAPGKTLVVTAGERSLPRCSYPNHPRYRGGPPKSAESYESAAP